MCVCGMCGTCMSVYNLKMCGGVVSEGVRRSLCRGVCKCKVCVMYVCRGMFMWGLHLSSVIRVFF